MKITDEQLMAYADGELDAQARRHVDAALASDPALAAALEKHRRLRRRVNEAFDPILAERVPDRLVSTLKANPTVVELATHRRKSAQPARRWSWPEWGAIAASLILGVIAGQSGWRSASGDMFTAHDGQIVARAELAKALSDRLASESAAEGIRVAFSFRSKQGDYCRAFTLGSSEAHASLAGVACYENEQWRMQTLARQTVQASSTPTYRQAASTLPTSILTTVSDMMDGEPLDVGAEDTARTQRWHK